VIGPARYHLAGPIPDYAFSNSLVCIQSSPSEIGSLNRNVSAPRSQSSPSSQVPIEQLFQSVGGFFQRLNRCHDVSSVIFGNSPVRSALLSGR